MKKCRESIKIVCGKSISAIVWWNFVCAVKMFWYIDMRSLTLFYPSRIREIGIEDILFPIDWPALILWKISIRFADIVMIRIRKKIRIIIIACPLAWWQKDADKGVARIRACAEKHITNPEFYECIANIKGGKKCTNKRLPHTAFCGVHKKKETSHLQKYANSFLSKRKFMIENLLSLHDKSDEDYSQLLSMQKELIDMESLFVMWYFFYFFYILRILYNLIYT